MSFNGPRRNPSSSSSRALSWADRGKQQLKKLFPKNNNTSNDSRRYNNTPLSLRDELAESHHFNRPSTDDAKNESNAANRVRRRRLDEGRHENVRRHSNK